MWTCPSTATAPFRPSTWPRFTFLFHLTLSESKLTKQDDQRQEEQEAVADGLFIRKSVCGQLFFFVANLPKRSKVHNKTIKAF